jgi:integration host factor subunit beta
MTRADLIDLVSRKGQVSRSRAETLVETIFDSLEESMRRGEKIELRGFGTFQVRHYEPYTGRNPRTGQIVAVNAKRLPYFKVCKELANRVNQGRADKNRIASVSPVATSQGALDTTESAWSG